MHYVDLSQMRILHRDMKAANLLISNKGVLQIADFGLARMFYEDPPDGELGKEYTNMVVTRWYRPPELLLGERRYTSAIDLWGVGCILAEMYKGKPILQGQSDIDQLDRIFTLCGTPTENTMPGWTRLPGCEGIRSFKYYPRLLERDYQEHGKDMVHLFGHLLDLDPRRRLTAQEALDHDYFTSDPLPANPDDLPNYEASHELDNRKRDPLRKEERPPRAPDAAGQMANGNGNVNGHAVLPRDAAALPSSFIASDRRPPGGPALAHIERDSRERSHNYTRQDDRLSREDRPPDTHRESNREPERDWDRDRNRGWSRDRERDRNDRGPTRDTYIPSYSKARAESPPRRERYAPDPGESRGTRRDYYQEDRAPRQYNRDDRDHRDRYRPRSRSRSRTRR